MTEQEELFAFRNRLLTKLNLTERADIGRLREDQADRRFMDVWFKGDDEYGLPRFRVYHTGTYKIADTGEANSIASAPFAEAAGEGLHLFPALLAVYSQIDKKGWITWVAKPGHHTYDSGLLAQLPAPDCRPFDRAALDEIVNTVKAWKPSVEVASLK